jgi:hypothetical protein
MRNRKPIVDYWIVRIYPMVEGGPELEAGPFPSKRRAWEMWQMYYAAEDEPYGKDYAIVRPTMEILPPPKEKV